MGQLGFFDLNRRYESLTEKNEARLVGLPLTYSMRNWPGPGFIPRSTSVSLLLSMV